MSTILGPLPCQACRQPVHVVRRTVEVPCGPLLVCDNPEDCWDLSHVTRTHTHAIPDVAWTVVEADGARHLCEAAAA